MMKAAGFYSHEDICIEDHELKSLLVTLSGARSLPKLDGIFWVIASSEPAHLCVMISLIGPQ